VRAIAKALPQAARRKPDAIAHAGNRYLHPYCATPSTRLRK